MKRRNFLKSALGSIVAGSSTLNIIAEPAKSIRIEL